MKKENKFDIAARVCPDFKQTYEAMKDLFSKMDLNLTQKGSDKDANK